jgi:hypothetical protein
MRRIIIALALVVFAAPVLADEPSASAGATATGAWAQDHNFISPPQ